MVGCCVFGPNAGRGFSVLQPLAVACTLNDPLAPLPSTPTRDASTPRDAVQQDADLDASKTSPGEDGGGPSPTCDDGEARPCGPNTEDGICNLGIRRCEGGAWGECADAVYPAPRDCGSELDNDCDGQPDNLAEGACRCVAGSTEPCGAHPGLDGAGPCRAGVRTCLAAEGGLSSDWGPCLGAVGPNAADNCAVQGNDGNCNGTPNDTCPCVEGVSYRCGPASNLGICDYGTATCLDGRLQACQNATLPRLRDCSSELDNNCDDIADDTVDSSCRCAVGAEEDCNTHPGLDGIGECKAGKRRCVLGATTETSDFGACEGAVGRTLRDCSSDKDNDCDGVLDNRVDAVCGCAVGTGLECDPPPVGHTSSPCRPGRRACTLAPDKASSAFSTTCEGAVGPAPNDSCALAGDDANCDGVPNGGCECVTARGNADCSTKPSAAVCSAAGTCTACRAPADCALVTGLNVCSAGTCVECTPADSRACTANERCENQACVPVVTGPADAGATVAQPPGAPR